MVRRDLALYAATLWDGCDVAVSSGLGYPEVRAALAAAGQARRLSPTDQGQAEAAWRDYWAATRAIELTEEVTAHAGQLAASTPCEAPTRCTLASPLAVGGERTLSAARDQRLRSGAVAAGVELVPMP